MSVWYVVVCVCGGVCECIFGCVYVCLCVYKNLYGTFYEILIFVNLYIKKLLYLPQELCYRHPILILSLCGNILGALYMHSADVMRSDPQWGSNPQHLQVGAFKSLSIWCICRGGVLSPFISSVC